MTVAPTLEDQHMKRFPDMKGKFIARSFAAILLLSLSLVPVASADSDAIVHNAGGVPYVSGGVGEESIGRLNALAGDFNLKLVFALRSGAYVNGVGVAIADAKGKTLVDTTAEGPWFLAKLPTGNYQVVATFAGNAVKRQVAVGGTRLRTIDFRWPSD
jgi:hypothetical protein